MAKLERLEFWTDVEPAGGQRLAVIGQWLAASERVTLDGEDQFTLTLLRDNPALVTLPMIAPPPSGQVPGTELNGFPPRVLRAVHGDGTIIERRIESFTETNEGGDTRVTLSAQGMLHELSYTGLCFRTRGDGSRAFNFQASSLTMDRHFANYILPALQEAGQPWWALGTLEYAPEVTIVYDKDSPLAAFRKLISAAIGALELRVRYDAAGHRYLIDLVQQVGSGAATVRLRAGRELSRLGITRSAQDVVTRVYGFGGYDEELGAATLGQNAFAVTGVRSDGIYTWLTLTDPAGGPGPIALDRQFSGGRLEFLKGSLDSYASFDIVDSLAGSQEVKVTTPTDGSLVPPPSAAKLYRLRTSATSDLAYVERPLNPPLVRQPLGNRVGYVERPEALGVLNIMWNPMLRLLGHLPQYVYSFAPGWEALPTNTSYIIDTYPPYTKTAGRAVRATFSGIDGAILVLSNAGIAEGPVSYWADCLCLRDYVQVELWIYFASAIVLPDGTSFTGWLSYPKDWAKMHPGTSAPDTWFATKKNVYQRLGIENCHDATRYPVNQARVYIKPRTGASTVVNIDAVQVTATQTWREIVEGTGANLLLQDANARLALYSDMDVQVNMQALDLAASEDPSFATTEFTLGGPIIMADEALGVQVLTRTMGWDRDHLAPENLRVQIASAGNDISRILASRLPSIPPVVRG